MDTKLRQTRLKAKLTQVQVAEKTGVSIRHYQAIEAGNHSPNVQTALKIARVLNATVEDIFG